MRARLEGRRWRRRSYKASEFVAEKEGRFDVAPVVLVEALCIEEVDVCYCCMRDFDD